MAEYYTNLTLSGLPIALSQQVRFSSASEVTTMLKRTATTNYYRNYPQSQKAAYASTYTTFLGGSVYNAQKGSNFVSPEPTCTTNNNGFVLANNATVFPGREKQTNNMFVAIKAVVNNPQ